ncbi:MAG: hypothetical protein LDL07_00115 [Desulfarculus sp.]|nr:hypothetical protein [Desulfarculus sp.]
MDNIKFGVIMTTLGMGGTLVSLWLLTLVMTALKRAFPERPETPANTAGKEAGK